MNDRPRVFIVDDHQLFRSGVRTELGDAVDVVGDADEVAAAIELITERKPDVVLIDVHMPDGGGRAVIEAVAAILKLTCDELGPDKDITQIVQPLEQRAGVEVRAPKT